MKLRYEVFYCDMMHDGEGYSCNAVYPILSVGGETFFSVDERLKEKQIIKAFNRFLGVEMTGISYDDFNGVYELYNDDFSEMYQLRG